MRFLFLILLLTSTALSKEVLTYKMLARTSFEDSHVLPVASFFTNSSADINNKSDFALKLVSIDWNANQAIWLNDKLIYTSPLGRYVTDPSINDNKEVVFTEFDQGRSYGIYKYFPTEDETLPIVTIGGPHNIISFDTVVHDNSGMILARATNVFGERLIVLINPYTFEQFLIVKESSQNNFSYLFTPQMNNFGSVALKARYGDAGQYNEERPDDVLLFQEERKFVLAEDSDKNNQSPIKKIRNSIAINDLNQVLYFAELENETALILTDGQSSIKIATTTHPDISEFDFFNPSLNNNGVIAFRAKDGLGVDAVFATDGYTQFKIAYEGQVIESDLGPATIFYDGNNPPFGGSPDINDKNEIIFSASLRNPADLLESYGSSIIKATLDLGYYYYGR